jgi:translation initiation factor 6 (eIF-6)
MAFHGSPQRHNADTTALVSQTPTVPNEKVQEFQATLKVRIYRAEIAHKCVLGLVSVLHDQGCIRYDVVW